MRKIDRTGFTYDRLTVIGQAEDKQYARKRVYWKCQCVCGKIVVIQSDNIGKTRSCGCLHNEITAKINYKHGEANRTKEHSTWQRIKDRCYNPKNEKYNIYGNRGIKMCERWLNNYEYFLADMGRAPSPSHSIDRIDVNGDYEPVNCRWATAKEQANNIRRNVVIEYSGQKKTLKQWSEFAGINYKYLHAQIKYKGKTLKQVIDGRL